MKPEISKLPPGAYRPCRKCISGMGCRRQYGKHQKRQSFFHWWISRMMILTGRTPLIIGINIAGGACRHFHFSVMHGAG